MDGLIPLIFKVLKKKKAMRYYRSLSYSSSAAAGGGRGMAEHIDVAGELARLHHHSPTRALRWHHHDAGDNHAAALAAAAGMTPHSREKLEMAKASGSTQRIAVMEALPRETFSPRVRGGAVAPAIGRSNLGVGYEH